MNPILELDHVSAGYDGSTVLDQVSLAVEPGEVVALLGRNGVGKSTLAGVITGTIPPSAGRLRIAGQDLTGASGSRRFRSGLRYVRQDRPVLGELTVQENLALSGVSLAAATERFAFLETRGSQKAGTMSGGEQKMLAMARQSADPGVLWILDEPTEGLQPHNVDRCTALVSEAAGQGCGILLIEQHLPMALACADRFYVLEKGQIVLSGPVDESTHDTVTDVMAV